MSTVLYIAAGWQWAQGDLWWGILWFILGALFYDSNR